jgi:hypothetical protein
MFFELFSNNVSLFSSNVSRRPLLFSVNLGRKRAMFSSQTIYVLGPLQIRRRLTKTRRGRSTQTNALASAAKEAPFSPWDDLIRVSAGGSFSPFSLPLQHTFQLCLEDCLSVSVRIESDFRRA